jgi:hypothetical protein
LTFFANANQINADLLAFVKQSKEAAASAYPAFPSEQDRMP